MKAAGIAIAAAAAGAFLCGAALLLFERRTGTSDRPSDACTSKNPRSQVTIRPVSAVEKRGFTKEELCEYDGIRRSDIYVSVKRVVYEVAPQLYGPGQPYNVYAGHEISRCLAKSDLSGKEFDKDWATGCSQEELDRLELWSKKFESKYPVVGWFVADRDFFFEEKNCG